MFSYNFTAYYILDPMVRKAVPRLIHGIVGWQLNDRRVAGHLPREGGISPNRFSRMSDPISIAGRACNLELSNKASFEKEPERWNSDLPTKRRS
jgi:hypothetical protein